MKMYMPFLLSCLWFENNNLKYRNSPAYKMFILTHFCWKRPERHHKVDGASDLPSHFLLARWMWLEMKAGVFPSSPNLLWLKHTWHSPRVSPPTTLVSVKMWNQCCPCRALWTQTLHTDSPGTDLEYSIGLLPLKAPRYLFMFSLYILIFALVYN